MFNLPSMFASILTSILVLFGFTAHSTPTVAVVATSTIIQHDTGAITPSASSKQSPPSASVTNSATKKDIPESVSIVTPQPHSEVVVPSTAASLLPTGSAWLSTLTLGDNKYVTAAPKQGYIYLCGVHKDPQGAFADGSWIHGTVWTPNEKLAVQGSVPWPSAYFTIKTSGQNRIISSNDLPTNSTTGVFPISSTDPAYGVDRNPNTISAHTLSFTIPVTPTELSAPQCIGGEVGIMTNGVMLFDGFDADLRDAGAHEVQDSCDGHPQVSGEYHYHSLSSCFNDLSISTILGYAFDGYPITGPKVSEGHYLHTSDLDECHGLTSSIMLDGKMVNSYHYVMTQDFPYSVSCFRGKSTVSGPTAGPVTNQSAATQSNNATTLPNGGPPQEAYTACQTKSQGATCSFTGGRGETVSGTCSTPPGASLVCVPAR